MRLLQNMKHSWIHMNTENAAWMDPGIFSMVWFTLLSVPDLFGLTCLVLLAFELLSL